tara:strand:- start:76 stop:585 length:510 start_codon:yes stop_codon:yes gene_type:complete
LKKKITLEKLKLSHSNELFPFFKEDNFKFTSFKSHKDIQETKKKIKILILKQNKKIALHFCLKLNGKIIGLFSILNLAQSGYYKILNTELSFWVGKKYQNKNYGYVGCKKLIEYCKKKQMKRLIIFTHKKNKASEKLSFKLGFKKLCLMKKLYMKDNKFIDAYFWEKLL